LIALWLTDTSTIIDSSKVEKPKKKQNGTKFVIFDPSTLHEYEFENIDEYTISNNGKLIGFNSCIEDSVDSIVVNYFDTESQEYKELFRKEGYGKKITVDEQGEQLSFIYSKDTTKEKHFVLNIIKLIEEK